MRIQSSKITIEKGSSSPLVSIVVVDSRSVENPKWVEICLDSIYKQWFKDWELILVNNTDRTWSIGKAFMEASKMASTEWVLFVGDDDFIQPDYIMGLYLFAKESYKHVPNCIGVTSYGFLFNEEQNKMGLLKKVPFGMMRKDNIMKIGFDELLDKHIDVDFLERSGVNKGKANVAIMFWNYGYFYRSHDQQVSGRKQY